ncbi:MAG TPA: substrate-binding domain-containing protein [Baekduia sp.]|nr:substrate-binding domain-containing protein [Baekduia sp.]
MRRWVLMLVLLVVAAAAAGCGDTTVVREGPITVRDDGAPGPAVPGVGSDTAAQGRDGVRIWVVTHGQASSPFWAIVRNGVEASSRQMDALVTYRAPDVYSLRHMVELVDQAIAAHPDGLVVSLPEPGLAPAVRRAVRAGIPVVTINSGSDTALRLGVLAHVGQPEERAGYGAGQRLARLGVRRALCVNLEIPNQGLDDRCAGLARAMRQSGGSSTVLRVDDQSPTVADEIDRAVRAHGADGVLAMNATSGLAAAKGLEGRQDVTVATFDLGADVLRAVRAGSIAFAVDQQAYLQGYLPVVLLTQRARYGLFPAQGQVIPTGPNFVTRDNADKAIALAARSIR